MPSRRTSIPAAPIGGDGRTIKLSLRGVSKRYSEVVAVRELSLDVREGEFLTLLGPSGSGKTTTLMMVAGFIEPDRGNIFLDGDEITHVPAFKRNIGVVFQNYALFPHMTVSENIAFPLRMRGSARADTESKVESVLDLMRMSEYRSRYPRQLSGGQQQRIALARALVFNPPILLMDEPLGALDRKLREEMQLEIKRIQGDLNVTVLHVTHDQGEALVMSDRIALLHGGRIEQLGPPRDLYERPASRLVAEFLGEMNLFEAEVVGRQGGYDRVRTRDHLMLKARLPEGARAGSLVSLAIRPEKVEFAGEGGRFDNHYQGRIVDEFYLGESVKFVVRIADETVLTVKRQTPKGSGGGYRKGDVVSVGWMMGDMSVFAGEKP